MTHPENLVSLFSPELFPQPKLEVIPPQPMEGGSVNLSCRTQLPLERSDAVLSFSFFRDRGVVLSNWSSSPELQITAVWREDSGSYWCEASAAVSGIRKRSLPLQVRVHGECPSGREPGLWHPPLQLSMALCREGPPSTDGLGHPDGHRLALESGTIIESHGSFPPLSA